MTAILNNFRVGRLWIGREVTSPALASLESLARTKHIPVEHESAGQKFAWSGAEAELLWPALPSTDSPPTTRDRSTKNSAKNNDSLVLRLRCGKRTLLLPGDAEKEAERAMLSENGEQDLQADVLKIGHHGSKIPSRRSSSGPSGHNWVSSPQVKKIPTAIPALRCWSAWNPRASASCAPIATAQSRSGQMETRSKSRAS